MGKHKHKHPKRGYPVAILIIFEARRAFLWQVFSEAIKPLLTLSFVGKRDDQKSLYAFHERVVDALRPMLKEGIRSVILVSPPKTTFSTEFLDHVQDHHLWLVKAKSPNAVSFGVMEGTFGDFDAVATFVQSEEFKTKIAEVIGGEADQIMAELEKRLQKSSSTEEEVHYALNDIENLIFNRDSSEISQMEYILVTDEFLSQTSEKNRVQRLLQIAQNKKVKTRIMKADTRLGERLTQLGGLVWFTIE